MRLAHLADENGTGLEGAIARLEANGGKARTGTYPKTHPSRSG